MSDCWCDFESPTLYTRRKYTARKAHTCTECRRSIQSGEQYENAWGIWNGSAANYKACSHCLALREWVAAHVPCFCWAHTSVRSDAMEVAREYAHEAPGLLFGAWRREIAIRRVKGQTNG